MIKQKKVEKEDLIKADIYARDRTKYRRELLQYKKNRRIALGPHAAFYFESFETILGQIQEMLHIEKGGEEQLIDEKNAYNPLIPKGNELVATLMFEIDDINLRKKFLNKVGGIEENVYIQIKEEKIIAFPEKDIDRTSAEGKSSSVLFLHFIFTDDQILKFKDLSNEINIGISHSMYNYKTKILDNVRKSLIKDFD